MADEIPMAEVQALASQGKSEREIIHDLKGKGYSNESISKALSAAIKSSVESSVPSMTPAPAQPKPVSMIPKPLPQIPPPRPPPPKPVTAKEATYALPPQPPMTMMREEQTSDITYPGDEPESIPMTVEEEIKLEELIEEMINDKWKPIEDTLVAWDKAIAVLQEKMLTLDQRLANLENRHDTIREDIRAMMSTSNDHIEMIQSRMGSVEKLFKEFVPSLTELARSLPRPSEKKK